MKPLTKRQEEVLTFIREHISEYGLPPTRLEIASALGFRSPNAAEEHLRALRKKNAILMIPNASRGIQLVEKTGPKGIPLIGKVAAGNPILAEENIEEHYDISEQLFKPKADFLLKVDGMSMKDSGIMDGDLLAVHKTNEAHNGQVVVARLGNEVTVKRFKRRHNKVHLMPENDNFEPIIVDLKHDEFTIEGLGVGIIRASSL